MMWALMLLACSETGPSSPTYNQDVMPILQEHCVRCHTSDGRRDGGVELDQYLSARSGRIGVACTASIPSVVDDFPGVLISPNATEGEADCHRFSLDSMPPGAVNPMSIPQQRTLIRWVELGAPQ